jgi:hypothetical protein
MVAAKLGGFYDHYRDSVSRQHRGVFFRSGLHVRITDFGPQRNRCFQKQENVGIYLVSDHFGMTTASAVDDREADEGL